MLSVQYFSISLEFFLHDLKNELWIITSWLFVTFVFEFISF